MRSDGLELLTARYFETEMYYFAYGSNMSSRRLKARVRARAVGAAKLREYYFVVNKRSKDGSAKCNVVFTRDPENIVWGVLFEIEDADLANLDAVEGLGKGYGRVEVSVILLKGITISAYLYMATETDASLRPYSWYMNHVLSGALEHGLPNEYVQMLKAIETVEDHDIERDHRERMLA